MTTAAAAPTRRTRGRRRVLTVGARVLLSLLVPGALYYLLRALGQSVYLSLVVSTVLSALPAVVTFLRHRRVDGFSTYVTAMLLGGLAVSLVPGSTRFLLAREAVMTGVTGVWFLVSAGGRSRRPLAYLFSRPLLEGRLRWPGQWDQLWEVSPLFRRLWRVSSVLWGLGLLADAAARVVLAYTVRPDLVPALGVGLYVATVVVLNLVVTLYQVRSRVHDPRSPLRQAATQPQLTAPAGTS